MRADVAGPACHQNHVFYMDASRLPRTIFGVLGQIGCSSISGLLCRLDCLLALMESADPRLILLKDSKSYTTCRLDGSRSDLFAITLLSTLRNLYGGHSFLQVVDAIDTRCAPALYGLTHKLPLVRPLMGENRPDRPRHLVGLRYDRYVERPALA